MMMRRVWGAWLMSATVLSRRNKLLLDCGSGSVCASVCLIGKGGVLSQEPPLIKLAHEAPPQEISSKFLWSLVLWNTHTACRGGITQTHGLRCCAVASMPLFSGGQHAAWALGAVSLWRVSATRALPELCGPTRRVNIRVAAWQLDF
jgi:hypothetical protein